MADNHAVENEGPESDTLEVMERDRRARTRKLAIGGGALVLAIGGGVVALTQYQEAQGNARVEAAWNNLSHCLVGDPLAAGERADMRFRAVQLTAMTLPEPKRAPASGQSWPGRCGALSYAFSEALYDAGKAKKGDKDVAFWADALGKQLKEGASFNADLSENITHTFEEAEKLKLTMTAAAGDAPPPLAHPLTSDALAGKTPLAKAPFSLKSLYTDPHPNQKLHLLVDEKSVPGSPFLCTITAQKASCGPLPKAITDTQQGVRLLGTADDEAAPLVFAGKRGASGVYRSDTGEKVEQIFSYGGYAAKDGFSAILGWNEGKDELVLIRKASATGKPNAEALKPDFRMGNFYYNAQLLWDQVMLRGVTKSDSRRLFSESLGRGDKALGDPVDIGELTEAGLTEGGPDEPPHIAGCRTAEAMVVRVKGYDNEFVSFLMGGKWSNPVLVPATGGTLSCRKADAAITGVYPSSADSSWKTTVEQRRCTSAGCNYEVVKMEQLLSGMLEFSPKEGRVVAADLDGKMLIVWAAGDRGGVRMRIGSAEQIATSPDIILFDDMVKDGKVQNLSTLFDMRIYSREGYAILVLSTVGGVSAVKIEPDGKFAPLAIDWAK